MFNTTHFAGSAVLGAIVLSTLVYGDETGAKLVTATDAWARPSILADRPGAAYATLRNTGETDDRLIAAVSPVAETIELHTHQMTDGVMTMMRVESIPVPAGGETLMGPGGLHFMLFGLQEKLAAGQTFPITLQFEYAGAVTTQVTVSKAPPKPAGNHGGGMHHGVQNHGTSE